MRARWNLAVVPVVVPLWLGSCAPAPAVLFEPLAEVHRDVASDAELVARYVDQGLTFTYGFNHDEAVRSFEEAARIDAGCAMAWWGLAFALGPNIDAPLEDETIARRAYDAARTAYSLREQETGANRALIEALVHRYCADPPGDRAALDRAYANAMREVFERHRDDADVGALFADSMLNLAPWSQWQKDGTPNEGTLEIVETLESVLELNPRHVFANHLYIHTVEGSKTPERGLASAAILGEIAPGVGHLVHMPAHIYIWTGDYARAMEVNQRAVEIDRAYFAAVGHQETYELYHAHDHHFLAYAAMFSGHRESALRAGRDLVAELPKHLLEAAPDFAEGFLPVVWHAMIRFGLWEEILAEALPPTRGAIVPALWHYARGLAFANTRRLAEARAEALAFESAAAQVTDETLVGFTPARQVVEIARRMLDGEIRFHGGDPEGAFAALREAVEREDALPYDEPRGWMQPVRHALGALLLESGRVEEAEAVYRRDLEIHRENGWSLHGLAECLHKKGEPDAAREVETRLARAWSRADTPISASCYCRGATSRDPVSDLVPTSP